MNRLQAVELQSVLEADSEPLVRAAVALHDEGLGGTEIASLFGNYAALFALRNGYDRERFLRLCDQLFELTAHQLLLLDGVTAEGGDA